MTTSISDWLEDHGLSKYTEVFLEHEVDLDTLKLLTDEDLKELGLPLGPRKRLLNAIAQRDGNGVSAVATPTAVGERRQLTVLFCDMVGFTELAGRLDPEVLQTVVSAYEDACAVCITRYDGYVFQRLGDGIVAFFGYPLAHEGEAERAIRAGLKIVEALAMQAMPAVGHLQVRIGIATGEVVVASGDKGAVGETMNLAARLQSIAQPGSIVVSERVQHLAGGTFEYLDWGELTLKGIAHSTHAYVVARVGKAANRFEAATQEGLTPLVGRERELELLVARWDTARAGDGQVAFLSGEPGIGKSRIASVLRRQLEAHGALSLRFQCSPFYVNSAFYPSIDNIERTLVLGADESPHDKLDKLEAMMVERYGRPIEDVHLIASMLSIPSQDRYGALAMNPRQQKEATIRALVELIEAMARARPTMMLFEDVHWADPTTLEVLDLLVSRTNDVPLLVTITSRPEFESRWSENDSVTSIILARLTPAESKALVAQLIDGKEFPAELIDQIVEKADGIPLFIEELTKSIIESGNLELDGQRYRYTGTSGDASIPATLRDLLMARLDRIKPVKEVAQIGAAIGREFSYQVIAAVSPMSDRELQNALGQLTESGLAVGRGALPQTIYKFKHALVQDTAYESMLKRRRQDLHHRIAEVLEERFPTTKDTEPELLAHHFTAAGLTEPAVKYWQRAGELALNRFALAEANTHLSKGLSLVEALPSGAERDLKELGLRSKLGPTLVARSGWAASEVGQVLEPAWVLAKSLHYKQSYLPVLHGLWVHALTSGRLAESDSWGREMLATAEAEKDGDLELSGHRAVMTSGFWLGDLVRARHHGDTIRSLYDPERHGHIANLTNSDPLSGDGIYRGQYLWMLGYPDAALALTLENQQHAAQRNHPFDLAFTLTLGAQVFDFCCQPDELIRYAEEAERVGREHGLPVMSEIMAAISKGIALLRGGHIAESVGQLREGVERLRRTGQVTWDPYLRGLMAHATGLNGDPAGGLVLIEESLEQIEARHEKPHLAEVLRIKGCLLNQQSKTEEAENALRAAIDFAREQQAKSWELRATTTLARHLAERGERRPARQLLAPVYQWFTEGFDTKDLQDARSLLDELEN